MSKKTYLELLEDQDPQWREAACALLFTEPELLEEAAPILAAIVRSDRIAKVRAAACATLARVTKPTNIATAIEAMLTLDNYPDEQTRINALEALGSFSECEQEQQKRRGQIAQFCAYTILEFSAPGVFSAAKDCFVTITNQAEVPLTHPQSSYFDFLDGVLAQGNDYAIGRVGPSSWCMWEISACPGRSTGDGF